MYIKVKGIIIREAPYRENDKILTVLTDEMGKITVKGRGVKKIKNPLSSLCNMFVFSHMNLYKKNDRFTLESAERIEQFYELREDISILSLANYFAKTLSTLAQENVPSGDILSLFLNTLYILCRIDKDKLSDEEYKKSTLLLIKSAFELRLACLLGYTPLLESCQCSPVGNLRFDIQNGELCCDKCSLSPVFKITPSVLSAMRYICTCDIKRLFSFSIPLKEIEVLNRVSQEYLSTQAETDKKSLEFFYTMLN